MNTRHDSTTHHHPATAGHRRRLGPSTRPILGRFSPISCRPYYRRRRSSYPRFYPYMSANPFDIFATVQDALMARLLDGRIRTSQLAAALRLHVDTLGRHGFTEHEAAAAFWDCVHTAQAERAREREEVTP